MSEAHPSEQPPGPDGRPVVGNTFSYASDPLAFIRRVSDEYGPVATYRVGGEQMYQVSSPEYVKQVLVENNEHYVKGDLFQNALRPVLGNGLLTSEGGFWRDQRHTMQPAFHPDAIQAYADVMVDYTERLLDDWTDGETRDIHEDMMRLTVEIAAKALFDVDIRTEQAAVGDALEAVMDLTSRNLRSPVNIPTWVPTPLNRRYRHALEDLQDVSQTVIERRKHEGVGEDPTDVVGLLLNAKAAGAPIDEQQLVDEVVTILLAGHETTALALTYTFHALGETPDAESRLHDEVDDVLGNRRPTYDDIDDLTAVDQCITEGMRLYPPVWELLRETTRDETFDGYVIPGGSTVAVQQWVLHHDDTYYDDPWTYRPERWTPEFRQQLPGFAYFPFGGGPRRCIGDRFALQEARLALATTAQDWQLRPKHDLEFAPSITLRPDGEVQMTVERRD